MSRPTTKKGLLEVSDENFHKLLNLVDSMPSSDREKEFPEGYLNRNIRDVIAHVHRWHLMLIDWYEKGKKGIKPDIPEKGYTWKTLPDLNKKIQEQYSHTDIQKARQLLEKSHGHVTQIIHRHTEEELFEKKRYPWTGTTSLAAYLISSTSSHYDWAYKLIKKCTK